jgi:hypothetical protein
VNCYCNYAFQVVAKDQASTLRNDDGKWPAVASLKKGGYISDEPI